MSVTAYERTGEPVCDASNKPIAGRNDLRPGDTVYVKFPAGGTVPLTVNDTVTCATSDSVSAVLDYDPGSPRDGVPGAWVAGGFFNNANKATPRRAFRP